MSVCEDAPCCGCCGQAAWAAESRAEDEARYDDDWFYDRWEDDDEPEHGESGHSGEHRTYQAFGFVFEWVRFYCDCCDEHDHDSIQAYGPRWWHFIGKRAIPKWALNREGR